MQDENNVDKVEVAEVTSEPPAVETLPAQPVISSAVSAPVSRRRIHKKPVVFAGVLALLAVAGGVFWYFQLKSAPQQAVTEQREEQKSTMVEEKPADPNDPVLAKFLKPTTGEVWLPKPKKIPAQGYLQYEDAATEYYEVGTRGDKTIIMSVVSELGDNIRLYERSKNGAVAIIALPDGTALLNDENQKYTKEAHKPTVMLDVSTHYDSLTMPSKLIADDKYDVTKPTYPGLGEFIRLTDADTSTVYKDIKTYGQSKLQRAETTYTDTKLTSIGYRLVTPINTTYSVGYNPLDVSLDKYQWQRGNYTNDTIAAIARGCGGRWTAVTRADAVTDVDLQLVGRSSSGLDVFDFKDSNHDLLKKAYEEFREFVSTSPDQPYANISKEDFVKEHGVVLHKDKYGQWLVYVRQQLRPGYGCAKPVVYLYPSVASFVTVKVGADVKISEPLYDPETGWKALAFPSGKLLMTSGLFDSLFWEGPGIGQYPGITSGTVVQKDQALATIQEQLKQLGLNSKERTDFVEYWQPKLPNKPYVRLTWLNTAQLNELAPLQITPKPDTLIRVFLDFAGLDEPIALPAQNLTTIPRSGFTVVEWGGLSPYKLY